MVHQYKNNGYNMVLDVCSGSVHVVDDLSYDVIALYEDHTEEEIVKNLSDRYSEKDIREAFQEVKELAEEGMLFTEDQYESYIFDVKQRSTVVKALCLHIAHDCNLACRYCFAEEGEYKGDRSLMSAEVGKKALDFLIKNSGNRINLEVDFFGGEEISLNGDNNHSQPSNASGDSISPPPVEKGTGREMNEKNRNQAPENPAYIDRSGVSEDMAPNPPTLCLSTLNENDGNVPTQHKNEDESDHQDQDSENDSDNNCKKGCTCY